MKHLFWEHELPKSGASVIVMRSEPLTDAEITQAFRGNENAPWYRALIQIIDAYRHDAAVAAGSQVAADNTLATAGQAGVYGVLSELLLDLKKRVAGD